MSNSELPRTPNWADFIDSLHVFNPPIPGRRRPKDLQGMPGETLEAPPVSPAAEHRAGGEN